MLVDDCMIKDIFFSYLPLAHNFERWAHIMVMAAGGRLAYYGGDTSKMLAELALVRRSLQSLLKISLTC